jgi:hypothetical protein
LSAGAWVVAGMIAATVIAILGACWAVRKIDRGDKGWK